MNWEATGAIAEALGTLAVLITLIYLAIQIRQNSRAILLAGYQDITNQWHTWNELLATTPDLASIVLKGNKSLVDLSPEESLRYGAYTQTFLDIGESYYRLIRHLELETEETVLKSIIGRRVKAPGMNEWWLANTGDYSEDFVSWIHNVSKAT